MKELGKALIEARRNMGKLVKDAKNPHFESNYATLHAVIETAQNPLQAAGIAVLESTQVDHENRPVQCLTLLHVESGDVLESMIPLNVRDPLNPQQVGSAQTYARRYLWQAAAGLAPKDDDDDGNAAAQTKPAAKGKTANQDASKAAVASKKKTLGDMLTKLGIKGGEQAEWIGLYCEHYAESKTLNESDLDALIAEAIKQQAEAKLVKA